MAYENASQSGGRANGAGPGQVAGSQDKESLHAGQTRQQKARQPV